MVAVTQPDEAVFVARLTRPDIEHEVHECIEFLLFKLARKWTIPDHVLRPTDVLVQPRRRLALGAGLARINTVRMAIANGPRVAARTGVRIRFGPQAFADLGEAKTVVAHVHVESPDAACRFIRRDLDELPSARAR